MTRIRFSAAVVAGLIALAISTPAAAIGILAPTAPDLKPLRLTHQAVDVVIDDQTAHTKISQTFYNEVSRPLEAHYLFPVPKGAKVTDFVLYINGEPHHAEMLESNEARRIYEDIVARMRDPGLLEYIDHDLFRVRVFPIPPRGEQKVELEYVQVLAMDRGAAEYAFPLTMRGQTPMTDPPEMDFDFVIESSVPIKSIYSPTHPLDTDDRRDHRVAGSVELSRENIDHDLSLIYTVSEEDIGLVVLPYRPDPSEDGYFSILISPRVEIDEDEIQPKAVTFVIDTSGSMSGEKIEQAKNSLIYCLNSLREQDYFNIIRFSTSIEKMKDGLIPASEESVRVALRWVDDLRASGGTYIDGALQEALSEDPPDDTIHTVVFMTDGLPTVGEREPERIMSNLEDRNEERLRVFTFGLGYDVNARLLDQIAEETRATSQYVRPEEDIEVSVSSFFDKVASPVLTNLELEIDGVEVRDLFPQRLGDLFLGTQLVLFGRYDGSGRADVRLEGELMGEHHVFQYDAEFPRESERHKFIEPLWAHRKVGFLLDDIRKHGESGEVVEEVTALAKKYAIVTPYTSFLVTEDVPMGRDITWEEDRRTAQNRFNISRGGRGGAAPRTDSLSFGEFEDFDASFGMSGGGGSARAAGAPAAAAGSLRAESGRAAVESSIQLREYSTKAQIAPGDESAVRRASERAFVQRGGVWVDQTIEGRDTVLEVKFLSAAYFEVLEQRPDLKEALALGENVEVRLDSQTVLKISDSGKEELDETDRNMLK